MPPPPPPARAAGAHRTVVVMPESLASTSSSRAPVSTALTYTMPSPPAVATTAPLGDSVTDVM
jgi:hypothetical protein